MIKFRDVGYSQETLNEVLKNPIVEMNFGNLKKDFEVSYDGFLSQEIAKLTAEEAIQLKTDIFIAYIMGAITAMDIRSNYRIGFQIPPESVSKKPLIFTGEQELYKGNESKIII